MDDESKSTTSKPPAKRGGGRILPSELPEEVAEEIAKLAGVPVNCGPFYDFLRDSVREIWKWDRRAGSSEPGEALKRAAKAARTLNEAVGSLKKTDREWVEKLLNQDNAIWSEEMVNCPPGRDSRLIDLFGKIWAIACLFSAAAGGSAPLRVGFAKLPYKVGKKKGTVRDETFYRFVFHLCGNAAEWGGNLSVDKDRRRDAEGGDLAKALNIIRQYLPNGVIPEKLPLMTLHRIKTEQAKARRSLLEP
jgi:hypothetical protein